MKSYPFKWCAIAILRGQAKRTSSFPASFLYRNFLDRGIPLRPPRMPWPGLQPERSPTRKLSARNQIKGRVVSVVRGQTTGHVRIDAGGGIVVTASITNDAI